VPVPERIIGAFLGKGGERVKSLKSEFGVAINRIAPQQPGSSGSSTNNSTTGLDTIFLEVSGCRVDVERCERRILDLVVDLDLEKDERERQAAFSSSISNGNGSGSGSGSSSSGGLRASFGAAGDAPASSSSLLSHRGGVGGGLYSTQLRIKQIEIGMVMGKGGETVKGMKREFGVDIRRLDALQYEGFVVLEVSGARDDVERCERYIWDFIRTLPPADAVGGYERKPCFSYENSGSCKFGDDCKYLHSVSVAARFGLSNGAGGAGAGVGSGGYAAGSGGGSGSKRARDEEDSLVNSRVNNYSF